MKQLDVLVLVNTTMARWKCDLSWPARVETAMQHQYSE